MLKLTGDPLIMGTVLAIAAVPRAVFMLLGGVITDRYSPRQVMLVSNGVRMVLVAALALTTWNGTITIWLIYGIAFLFGLADAFMFPAASAFPPRLLPPERLAAGNSLFQGTAQLTLVMGPLLAGSLIAGLGGQGEGGIEDATGLAVVFAIDALTFVLPLLILSVIRDRFPPAAKETQRIWASLVDGLRHTWNDLPLRTVVLLLAGLGLFFRGPFMVGIPAFADAFLEEGAAAFGIILSALGVGSIIGTLVAGMTTHLPPRYLGPILLVDFCVFGLIMVFMTQVPETSLIAAVVLVSAVLDGYIIIVLMTWLQQRVPAEKMGRVMSVIMVGSQGTFPVSAAVAGALAGWSVDGMLMGAGAIMVGVTALGLTARTVRRTGYD